MVHAETVELKTDLLSTGEAAPPGPATGRFALFLALLVLATFPGVLLGGRTFIIRDFGLFSYPLAHFHRESFWHGQLPLWNPFNYCGVPFLAQWNTMTLYPPTLIYLALPLTWSLPFFCLAHLFWGGLGMYRLAHRWTGHGLAAALGGVIFAFNGLTLNFLMWPSHVATFSWLPWMLWLVPEGWRGGGTKLVWGTLAGVMQMLAGGPETILLTWLLLFLLACGELVQPKSEIRRPKAEGNPKSEGRKNGPPEEPAPGQRFGLRTSAFFRPSDFGLRASEPPVLPRRRLLFRFLAMAGLVALICAAQLLPFIQLLAESQRDSSYSLASHDWAMPLWGWANFLVPLFQTSPNPQGVFLQNNQYWTSSYYAGIGTLFLSLVALRHVSDWRLRLLAGLTFLGLVLSWGDTSRLYSGLRTLLPPLGYVRYPIKFVIVVLALAPLLAAFGLSALVGQERRFGRYEAGIALTMLGLLGAIVWAEWKSKAGADVWHNVWHNALSRAFFLLLILALTAGLLTAHRRSRLWWGSLLVAAFWLDLATQVPNQNPTVQPSCYAAGQIGARPNWEPPPRLGEARAMVGAAARECMSLDSLPDAGQNYLRNRLARRADCNLLDDTPQIDGFFSLTPRHFDKVAALLYSARGVAAPPLLDFLGVSQITAPGAVSDWARRTSAMPLVTAGQQPVFLDDAAAAAALGETNIDFRRFVLLPLEARAALATTQPAAARVLAPEFSAQRVAFQIDTPAPSVAVLAQTSYPAWAATVDGQPARLWRANYAFQALQVPAGHHQVLLLYRDKAFLTGIVLSALGLTACLSVWVRAHSVQAAGPARAR